MLLEMAKKLFLLPLLFLPWLINLQHCAFSHTSIDHSHSVPSTQGTGGASLNTAQGHLRLGVKVKSN